MNTIRLWLIRKLLTPITNRAFARNDHILADNVIVIQDALDEIERRLKQ